MNNEKFREYISNHLKKGDKNLYNYIDLEPSKVDVPINFRYFGVTKEYPEPKPETGKKKPTKEQMKQYNDVVSKRMKTFDKLDSSEVIDMGNNYLVMDDIISISRWCIREDQMTDYIYKIKPINAKTVCKDRYSSKEEYQVSSFTVEKKIDNIKDLIDDFSHSDMLIRRFYGNVFDFGHYANEGNREFSIELFEFLKENYPSIVIYVSDCIMENPDSYKDTLRYENNNIQSKELGELLLEKGLIALCRDLKNDYEDYEKLLSCLIRAGWYKIACNLIDYIGVDSSYFRDITKNDDVMSIIRKNTDDEYVAKIIEKLQIKDSYITIIVKQSWDDGYYEKEIERKQFKNINEAREYVIKNYDVPFELAAKDIEHWRNIEEEIWFEFE